MTAYDDIMREFREFTRYTGDGKPGAPTNAPLPVGDPQSGVYNPKKANLRLALGNLALDLLNGISLVNGMLPALTVAREAALADIAEDRGEALTAIDIDRTAAQTAIATDRMLALGDIKASRISALSDVDELVDEAKAARDIAAGYVNDVIPERDTYSTIVGLSLLNPREGLLHYAVAGFAAVGDGGAANWQVVSSEPSHSGKHQWADGTWGELVAPHVVFPEMLGKIVYVATPYGVAEVASASDATLAIRAAYRYAERFGSEVWFQGKVYKCTNPGIDHAPNLNVRGVGPGKWYPTINASIADGVDKPDMAGTILLAVGTGVRDLYATGITDQRTAGGVVPNPDSFEPGFDSFYKLTEFYNDDANEVTGSAATRNPFSAFYRMREGEGGSLAGVRIMPSYNGVAGYHAQTLGLADDWDVGIYSENRDWTELRNVSVVGYWRKMGYFGRVGRCGNQGPGQSAAEHNTFDNCTFAGLVGFAIRGTDYYAVTAVGADYIETPWASNHPFDPVVLGEKIRFISNGGVTVRFTGVSKVGDKLRLTGVTPNPLNAGITTSSQFGPGLFGGGISNTIATNCMFSGLDHQAAVRATSAALGVSRFNRPSAAVEMSGRTLRGFRAPFSKIISHDDVAIHLHAMHSFAWPVEAEIESKTADGLGFGIRIIASPAEGNNSRVPYPAGQTYRFMMGTKVDNSADQRPIAPSNPPRFPSGFGLMVGNQLMAEAAFNPPGGDNFSAPPIGGRVGWTAPSGSRRAYYDDALDRNVLAATPRLLSNLLENSTGAPKLGIAGSGTVIYGDLINFRPSDAAPSYLRLSTTDWRPGTDNAFDLGTPSSRMKTIYAVTGAINTSDADEKDWRGKLSGAELRAFKRLLPQIGGFRWLDAVRAKGDDARLHIGLTVQMVIEAFEAEGLDPWLYAPICRDFLTAEITTEHIVQVQVMEDFAQLHTEVEMIDGRAVLVERSIVVQRATVVAEPVFNEDGTPVFTPEGARMIYQRPVLRNEILQRRQTVPDIGETGEQRFRLGLRMDQILFGLVAALHLGNSQS